MPKPCCAEHVYWSCIVPFSYCCGKNASLVTTKAAMMRAQVLVFVACKVKDKLGWLWHSLWVAMAVVIWIMQDDVLREAWHLLTGMTAFAADLPDPSLSGHHSMPLMCQPGSEGSHRGHSHITGLSVDDMRPCGVDGGSEAPWHAVMSLLTQPQLWNLYIPPPTQYWVTHVCSVLGPCVWWENERWRNFRCLPVVAYVISFGSWVTWCYLTVTLFYV